MSRPRIVRRLTAGTIAAAALGAGLWAAGIAGHEGASATAKAVASQPTETASSGTVATPDASRSPAAKPAPTLREVPSAAPSTSIDSGSGGDVDTGTRGS